jgi:transcriptional repressor NrdR
LCLGCGYRFFTNEVVCEEFPIVIKRDGREEEFDKEKVKNGLLKAFKKSTGVEKKVDYIYNGVIGSIVSGHPEKIKAEEIGTIIMDLLRASDPVAYMRFVSVYKNFESAGDFAFEFEKMSSWKPKN